MHRRSVMDWRAGEVVGYEPVDGTLFAQAAAPKL